MAVKHIPVEEETHTKVKSFVLSEKRQFDAVLRDMILAYEKELAKKKK